MFSGEETALAGSVYYLEKYNPIILFNIALQNINIYKQTLVTLFAVDINWIKNKSVQIRCLC